MMWTPEREAELKRLWPIASARQIAKELGTTRSAVIGKMHRLEGRYVRTPTPAEIIIRQRRKLWIIAIVEIVIKMEREINSGRARNEAIVAAYQAGATLQTIGEVLGVSRQRVKQIVDGQKESVSERSESAHG